MNWLFIGKNKYLIKKQSKESNKIRFYSILSPNHHQKGLKKKANKYLTAWAAAAWEIISVSIKVANCVPDIFKLDKIAAFGISDSLVAKMPFQSCCFLKANNRAFKD